MLNKQIESSEKDDADRGTEAVGSRLRELRLAHDMSQRKLASLAGLTNGAISMIEQDRVSPSIASLKKVLEVFGLSMADFFADDFKPDTQFFYRKEAMTRISDGPVVLRQVGGHVSRRKLQVLHEKYAKGGDTGPTMLSHEGEEAGVIVRGQIEITVGGQCEVLGPGDGYYFNSRLPHRFRNLSDEECEIVSTCTPPTF
jgi:transcriptional regulator with XRE-family HTH domain